MSDTEGDVVGVEVTSGILNVNQALQEVIKKAVIHDSIVRGIHEAVKALERFKAVLVILAENCEEVAYKKLVQALCTEHQVPLITIDDNKKLGEWAGLCKIDNEGKARKIVGCSCAVIMDWGDENNATAVIRDHLRTEGVV